MRQLSFLGDDGMWCALFLIIFSSDLSADDAIIDIKKLFISVEEPEYITVRGDAALAPDPVVLYPIEKVSPFEASQ